MHIIPCLRSKTLQHLLSTWIEDMLSCLANFAFSRLPILLSCTFYSAIDRISAQCYRRDGFYLQSIFVLILLLWVLTNCDSEAFASTCHILPFLCYPVRSCWSCLSDKLVWHSWMERVSGVLTRPDFAFPKHSLEWMSREGRQIYSGKDFPWNQMNQVFNGTTPSFAKGLKSRSSWTEISEKCKQHGNHLQCVH